MVHPGSSESKLRQTLSITQVSHPLATIWLARELDEEESYFYGGTRIIDASTSDLGATDLLVRLTSSESGIKNALINWSIEDGALNEFQAELSEGFLQARVGGARCLIRPRDDEIASSLTDPQHSQYRRTVADILKCIADTLNDRHLRIKLTPDFGRFTGLADDLYQYTPNVLGIHCEKGGCGGKSSYSTTGVLAGIQQAAPTLIERGPVTCIGSAGALGSGVMEHFIKRHLEDLAICDLVYDVPGGPSVRSGCRHMKSRLGSFTDECLRRGGVIVATTFGNELEASPWELIPKGSVLLLAHNLALPEGQRGIHVARGLADNGVLVIPGQVLTLGGALTARLEWYSRQLPSQPKFDKGLAHRLVRRIVSHLMVSMLGNIESAALTPYEVMLLLANKDRLRSSIRAQSTAGTSTFCSNTLP